MKMLLICALVVAVTQYFITSVDSARILVYPFGHCLNSHLLNAEKLSDILISGGHEVDFLVSSSYNNFEHRKDLAAGPVLGDDRSDAEFQHARSESNEDVKAFSRINLIRFQAPQNYKPICDYDTLSFMLDAPMAERFGGLKHTFVMYCDRLLSDRSLLSSLKSREYDLLVVEALDPCSRIIADYFDIPFVLLATFGLGQFDPNPRPPSYLPAAIAPFTNEMDFTQRVANAVIKFMYDVVVPSVVDLISPFEELRLKHGLNTTSALVRTFDRASLRFVNSDFTVDYPAPIEPDNILVGGFAVDKQPPPLPDDLEEFVSGSGDTGVIVVSFGTLIRHFGTHYSKMFMSAFSRLPQRVVWRNYDVEDSAIETEATTNASQVAGSNVRMMRWLPQPSLLSHPKTVLFISHCGLNAILEAAHYGVPVLAVPLSADHYHHAAKVSGPRLGMGETIDIRSMTSDSLYEAIVHLLTDNRYRENARRVRGLIYDQPSTPEARILYWVDYVIRHSGAQHLRSEFCRRLSWFQYWSLDVVTCLLGVATATVYVIYRLLLFMKRLTRGALVRLISRRKVD